MKRLTVLFPGIGYHGDKPLLYYSRDLAREAGGDVLTLQFHFSGGQIMGNEKKVEETYESLYQQAEEQLAEVAWDSYQEILFISKSIGTVIAAAYARRNEITCRHILYTPLEQTFAFKPERSIAFIGTSDPWSRLEVVQDSCREQKILLHCYEGANHSLETTDVLTNIARMQEIMQITKEYLFRNHSFDTLTLRE